MATGRERLAAWWPWIGLVVRVGVAAVWIVAGALKLGDLKDSRRAVRAYEMLPDWLEAPVGNGLPILELCVGALLLLGLTTRLAALVSAVLFVFFVVGIAQAWVRGLRIDCGCFGGGGTVEGDVTGKYAWEIARDVGLLAASLAVARWPRTRLALDSALFPPSVQEDADTEHDQEGAAR